ncbi:bifunctional O-acetylhomoserine aminocarboxypropyltransferase/cysteine synthase [Duganella sp. FT50W]|uniref:Bifunctional O-acetylhomoserine aminocarboxypropyltransferase/cysteine synthase n=1 Tax=Duganella lactea TaxID=2692173 RepID=A0A6L8ML30_9BURK|nr:PLP-dependent transferase [Duganella lactea]MYM83593.1 bifunctional O-acetylhomoserine aminocarboxypropyltransferase/cysteine synthase [Duganella lactea]
MSSLKPPGFHTLSLHAGATLPDAGATAMLEERIAALEGGVGAVATASGELALHLAISSIASAGAHIVASRALHAGTCRLLASSMKRFGIQTTFVDPRNPDAWRAAIQPETRLLFAETLSGGGLEVLDIPAVAAIAHEHRLPLMVDATLTTPWLLQPIAHGADLVLHAAAMGGLLVDGGTFDWQAAHEHTGRYAELCEPCDFLPGVVFAEESTVGAFTLRARHENLAPISPHHAAAILHGLETLPLRMERHVANTRKIVALLATHPAVTALHYPELPSHPDHEVARRLLPKGCGPTLSFHLKGALQVFSAAEDLGGARSQIIPPASDNDRLHLSIGLEEADDLLEDLSRALKLSQKGA